VDILKWKLIPIFIGINICSVFPQNQTPKDVHFSIVQTAPTNERELAFFPGFPSD
jgi:hypothetical protein